MRPQKTDITATRQTGQPPGNQPRKQDGITHTDPRGNQPRTPTTPETPAQKHRPREHQCQAPQGHHLRPECHLDQARMPPRVQAPGPPRTTAPSRQKPPNTRPRTHLEAGNQAPEQAGYVRPGGQDIQPPFQPKTGDRRRIYAEKIRREISDIRPSTNRICFLGQGPPRAPPGFARENQDIHLCRAPVAKLRSSRVNRKTYVGPPLLLSRARV